MDVDGGHVCFCDQVNDDGIKGSEAFCEHGESGYQTTVTLPNGAEFHADNNARQGSVYVDYVVEDSELTANKNQTGLVDASIISHSGTIKANDNKLYGWQLFEGTPSVIDAQSRAEVKRNGSEAANWGEFYWGAIITGITNVNLTVEKGANFEVTDNDCCGIRVNYGNSNLTIESGNISRNGWQNAPNGGGIYIVPKSGSGGIYNYGTGKYLSPVTLRAIAMSRNSRVRLSPRSTVSKLSTRIWQLTKSSTRIS